jgi:hypothetical protein
VRLLLFSSSIISFIGEESKSLFKRSAVLMAHSSASSGVAKINLFEKYYHSQKIAHFLYMIISAGPSLSLMTSSAIYLAIWNLLSKSYTLLYHRGKRGARDTCIAIDKVCVKIV